MKITSKAEYQQQNYKKVFLSNGNVLLYVVSEQLISNHHNDLLE